jgi:hypothetical protein
MIPHYIIDRRKDMFTKEEMVEMARLCGMRLTQKDITSIENAGKDAAMDGFRRVMAYMELCGYGIRIESKTKG